MNKNGILKLKNKKTDKTITLKHKKYDTGPYKKPVKTKWA